MSPSRIGVTQMSVNTKREPVKFKVRIFMGDKEITHDELKNYVIKDNRTIDRIINNIVDRAVEVKI